MLVEVEACQLAHTVMALPENALSTPTLSNRVTIDSVG
jgi:hypothetical protein